MLPASLFNSPPTVRVAGGAATSVVPAASGTTGGGMTKDSSNHALRIVTHAPATVAWPAPYAGWVGAPSGKAIGSRYDPNLLKVLVTACEPTTCGSIGYALLPV